MNGLPSLNIAFVICFSHVTVDMFIVMRSDRIRSPCKQMGWIN
jgi:hypothetical protein